MYGLDEAEKPYWSHEDVVDDVDGARSGFEAADGEARDEDDV